MSSNKYKKLYRHSIGETRKLDERQVYKKVHSTIIQWRDV